MLCQRLGVEFVLLETFWHGPNWTVRETFAEDVLRFLENDVWAIEWQGEEVRKEMTDRCDVLVWLDHPRWLVMARVVRRTLARRFGRGTDIPGGNSEGKLHTVFTDPEHIIRVSWRRYTQIRDRVRQAVQEHPDTVVVRLRGRRDVAEWLSRIERP